MQTVIEQTVKVTPNLLQQTDTGIHYARIHALTGPCIYQVTVKTLTLFRSLPVTNVVHKVLEWDCEVLLILFLVLRKITCPNDFGLEDMTVIRNV